MKKAKFKIGDKVKIIPHANHLDHVKKYYGRTMIVEDFIVAHHDEHYYGLDGIEELVPEDNLITSNK